MKTSMRLKNNDTFIPSFFDTLALYSSLCHHAVFCLCLLFYTEGVAQNSSADNKLSYIYSYLENNCPDSATTIQTLQAMQTAAGTDLRCLFLVKYFRLFHSQKLKSTQADINTLMADLKVLAKKADWEEAEIALKLREFYEKIGNDSLSMEEKYFQSLSLFEETQRIGMEKFRIFNPEQTLWAMGEFMYKVEDWEQMLRFLKAAELYIKPKTVFPTYLIYNYLQAYYSHAKDTVQVLAYAQKIIDFCPNYSSTMLSDWTHVYWQGQAALDIASILTGQGRWAEAIPYAEQGFQKSKVSEWLKHFPNHKADFSQIEGEFTALQSLLALKLKTQDLKAADALMQRAKVLEKEWLRNTDKALYKDEIRQTYYENCALYYEQKGDYAAAMHYTKRSLTLKDDINRQRDARKVEQLKKKVEIEQFKAHINLIEKEKQTQKVLFFIGLAVLIGLAAYSYYRYRHIQQERQQDITNLARMTDALRDKSAALDKLQNEIEQLKLAGQTSAYLEELAHASILTDEDWSHFKTLFEKVHPRFIQQLLYQHPNLTPAEVRLLVLEKLNLNLQEMANMLGVSKNTIHQTRYRLKRKIEGIAAE